MDRATLIDQISHRLGDRSLVWAGIRGDDVEPVADLPHLEAAYSIINAYQQRSSVESLAYEDLSGARVDLEIWNIDDNLRTEFTAVFRQAMLRTLARRSALLPYRPSQFLSAIWFARRDRCLNLGLFGGYQQAFEHKPWVETAVAGLGVAHIKWTYIADEEQLQTRSLMRDGPVMLRRSRTSGGEGIVRVDTAAELVARWPHVDEAFVSVSPYLAGGLPVNVGATVWHDGVTVHHPSVQLIGIEGCVTRPFGYCGNDFGLVTELDAEIMDSIEWSTRSIGSWLGSLGYRGTFGVDYLIHDGVALFTEINPRFQGSTHASSELSIEQGQGCLVLEHIAAMLDLDVPPQRPLRELVRDTGEFAHLVLHWTGDQAESLDPASLVSRLARQRRGIRADVLTRPELLTDPGAVVARFTVRERLTETGFEIVEPWRSDIDEWRTMSDRATTRPHSGGNGVH